MGHPSAGHGQVRGIAAAIFWVVTLPVRYVAWCLAKLREDDAKFEAMSDEERAKTVGDDFP